MYMNVIDLIVIKSLKVKKKKKTVLLASYNPCESRADGLSYSRAF